MTMGKRRSHGAENAVLFAALRGEPPPLDRPGAFAELDWGYILAAAGKQGIAPLLARWIGRGGDGVPGGVAERLDADYWVSHFRNRTLLQQLRRVAGAASEAGIPVMPLKGAALATRYYAAPALRPMADLDLLVRPADLPRMAAVLRELGYAAMPLPPSPLHEGDAAFGEYAYVAAIDDIVVLIEYRAEPLDPAIGALHAADQTMAARLHAHSARTWERATRGTIDGAPCMQIPAEDLLLHVASHLTTRHAGMRLLWLYDLRLIAAGDRETLDWGYIAAEARALNLEQPVRAALAAADRWLAASIPAEQLRALGVARGSRRSLQKVGEGRLLAARAAALGDADLTTETQLQWWPLAISVGRLTTMRPLLRALRQMILPSRAYMAWWSGGSVDSGRDYRRAAGLRLAYVSLSALDAAAIRLRLRPFARLTGRLIARMKSMAPYDRDRSA